MTKKGFKKLVRFEVYSSVSSNSKKTNAIFFDWQVGEGFRGYKYAICSPTTICSKSKLFDHFYNWVIKGENVPHDIRYKYAYDDQNRFKVGLSLNF